jgi:hypothetical protein
MKTLMLFLMGIALFIPSDSPAAVGGQTLAISPSGANVVVSWQGTNAWLQSTVNLSAPDEWTNASAVMDLGGGASVLFPTDQDQQFFRLVYSANLPPPTRAYLDVGNNFFYVYWDPVANAQSYNLYYATAPGVSPANYASLPGGTLVSGITDNFDGLSNLVAGVTYYFVVTAVTTPGESAPSSTVSGAFGPNSSVEGSVFTELNIDGQPVDSAVANVTVFLVNQANQQTSTTITDGDGNFQFPPQALGAYQVCWSAPGYIPGCSSQSVVTGGDPAELDPIEIFPDPGPSSNYTTVYGNITMGNGQAPGQFDGVLQINVQAQVSLIDTNGTVFRQTTANNGGDYSIAGVPTGSNFLLTAQVESAVITTNINTSVVGEADFVFTNSPPVIQSVTVLSNGQPIDLIAPGSTVQMQCIATDPNGYPLQYEWHEIEADGDLSNTNSQVATYADTNFPGATELKMEVRVSNGYGGYAYQELNIGIASALLVSGYVIDTNSNPIAGALVEVGTNETFADTNGFFEMELPPGQSNYSLEISAAGYLPLSAYETQPTAGTEYTLYPVTFSVTTNCTAGMPITASNSGASIVLQPCSLVDSSQSTYQGQFTIIINPYDPCDPSAQLPAGSIGTDSNGLPIFLEPIAAATITILDTNGQPLFINPALPATVTLTSGYYCPPPDPSTPLPAWGLDPVSGLWRPIGQAIPQAGPGTSVAFIFPIFQLGVLAVGAAPAMATLTVDADKTLNYPFQVRITGGPEPILALIELDGKRRSVEVPQNTPLTLDVLNPKEAPGEFYTDPLNPATVRAPENKTVVFETKLTVTTPAVTVPVSYSNYISALYSSRLLDPNQFLAYDTDFSPGVKGRDSINLYYGTAAQFTANRTTLGDFMAKNGFLPNAGSMAGYTEDAGAIYNNAQDLGFARSMHMKIGAVGPDGKTNIAYFVINYRRIEDALVDVNQNGLLTNVSGQVNGQATAIVAMDYAWDARFKKRATKFYVFDGPIFGFLKESVDLDGSGDKYVPNLCVVCHGGTALNMRNEPLTNVWPSGKIGAGDINVDYLTKKAGLNLAGLAVPPGTAFENMQTLKSGAGKSATILYPNPPDCDLGSYFIPFDLPSFTYSKKLGVQEAQFRRLNAGIYQYTPMTPAMKTLLEGWYNGGPTLNGTNKFTASFVPAGWSTQSNIYQGVLQPSCRACHLMQTGSVAFQTFNDFSKIMKSAGKSLVCQRLLMPNAQRNFSIFWGSQTANVIKPGAVPNQPAILTNQFGWSPCPTPKP